MKKFLIVLMAIFVSHTQSQLPPTFKICPRNSPNLADCIKNAIEHIRPHLKSGYFGHGWKTKSIESIFIDEVTIDKGRDVQIKGKNIKVFGASNFRIEKLKINKNTYNIDALVIFNNLEAVGNYKMNLKLAGLDVKGEGKFKVAADEIKLHITLQMERYTKNGEQFMRIANSPNRVVKLGKIKINLQDKFKDKILNDITNTIVNQNLYLFTEDFIPKVSDFITKTLVKAGNILIENVPFKFLLP